MFETELKKPITYWQYKNSHAFKTILDGMVRLISKYYQCELWELFDLDKAYGYVLDLIGQRLGYPRPKEIPESVGQYDISRYAQAYYDLDADHLSLVQDDTYRLILKLRIMMWQPWHSISINSMYKALNFAFPNVEFLLKPRQGQKVMDLYVLSYVEYPQRRALISDAIQAPLGQTLLVHFVYDSLQYLATDVANETLLQDGNNKNIVANLGA